MEENLAMVEKFFKYDLQVKKLMYESVLQDEDTYDQASLLKYEDKLFNSLKEMEYFLKEIVSSLGYDESALSYLKNKFEKINNEFLNAQGKPQKLKELYQKNISSMRGEFVESVNKGYKGYYLDYGKDIIEPQSINEYLHLFHAALVNDEKLYQSMPQLAFKEGNEECEIYLYGKQNDVAYSLFNNMPINDIDSRVDILSLDERLLIMTRDIGHASMLEITFENDKAFVNYFIPKITNYLKANQLKGITKVDFESEFAKGMFEVDKASLNNEVYTLLCNIPKDVDMFEVGGSLYNKTNKVL